MYNIAAPIGDFVGEYDRIVVSRKSARKVRLLALAPQVTAAYSAYMARATRGTPTPITLDERQAKDLKGNFSRLDKGAPFAYMRDALFSLTRLGVCPYCRLGTATTLDHVLEKAKYPEFSVLRVNLAPCCKDCNTSKEHKANARPSGQFFHPYFDGFPMHQYLGVDVQLRWGGQFAFRYHLDQSCSLDAQWRDRLLIHFQQANLAKRYAERAAMEVADQREYWHDVRIASGVDTLRKVLLRQAKSASQVWTDADWKYALLLALSKSNDFVTQV